MRTFIALLFVAFGVLSVSRQGTATQQVATGIVAEIPAAIKPGVRVTVWDRGLAERPMADKVRSLAGLVSSD